MPTVGKKKNPNKRRLKPGGKYVQGKSKNGTNGDDSPDDETSLTLRPLPGVKPKQNGLQRAAVLPPRPRKQGIICPHIVQALMEKAEEIYREIVDLYVIPSSKCLIPWDPRLSRSVTQCEHEACSGQFQSVCIHCRHKACRDHVRQHAASEGHGCVVSAEYGYVSCFGCGDAFVQMSRCAKIWRDHRMKAVYETALRQGWLSDLGELDKFIPDELREACEKHQSLVGVHGIVNLSNTCCLNVILQTFCHTPLFRDFCLGRLHRCCPNDLRFNPNCVMCAFSSMIFDLYILPPGQCYAPQLIFRAVRNSLVDHGSELGEQEDPAEIVNLLLNDMHLQSERDGRKISQELSEKLQLSNRELAVLSVAHGVPCSCIVCDLFSGVEEYTTTCLKCKQDRMQGNCFKLLMLPILDDKPTESALADKPDLSLEDCLKMYTDTQLTSEVKNECCVDVKGAYRTNKFRHLPVILIIQLKRAVAKTAKARIGDGDLKKNKEHIQFPVKLDMAPYMANPHTGATKYVLYGVTVHKGVKLSSGHYVCYLKHMSGRWLCMDDRAVFCFSEAHVLALQAYMLFYILETVDFVVTVARPFVSSSSCSTGTTLSPPYSSMRASPRESMVPIQAVLHTETDPENASAVPFFDLSNMDLCAFDHTYGQKNYASEDEETDSGDEEDDDRDETEDDDDLEYNGPALDLRHGAQ